MSEVPGSEPPRDDAEEAAAPAAYPPPYPPSYPAASTTSDDELAEALAAQTAMYTGPITLPVLNSDPIFRPDPDELQTDVAPPPESEAPASAAPEPEPSLPPLPVPPPPPVPEYIAPDAVASDPVVSVEPLPAEPVADEELSRTVEQEAAEGSTLDAILLLENELRRRQGLSPVVETDEPPAEVGAVLGGGSWDATPFAAPEPSGPDPSAAESSVSEALSPEPPVYELPVEEDPATELPGAAAFAAAAAAFGAPPPSSPPGSLPGWTDAPDPEREGEAGVELPAPVDDQAWLTAPPPSFAPPALVEPPPAPAVGTIDPTTLTPSPTAPLDGAVDATLLPPPSGLPADASPMSFQDAPPPVVAAVPLAPPPAAEALVVAAAAGDPETEGIDDLDRADLAVPIPVDDAGIASVAPVPLSTATVVAVGEPLAPEAPADPAPMSIEAVAAEPTPLERRAGHAARLFWLWFAANSSIVMIAIGATLFTLGLSLRQVLVAIVAGVALSALPLGLGSLAGKWSGQPTMIVSRATFGLVGNILPAVLAVLGRALWGGVLLWLLAVTSAAVLAPAGDGTVAAFVSLAVGAVVAGIVAVLGYGLLHRVQRVLGILSILLVAATIVVTAPRVDIATALRTDDGSWLLAVGGLVTVFSVVGLAWAQSSSDLARYQNPAGSGAANMLWGSFGVIVPTLLILSWGAVLAASDPKLAEDLARAPLVTLLDLVPSALALPLLGATAFGLVAGAIVTMYSGGLALVAVGLRVARPVATVIAAVLVVAIGAALLLLGSDTRALVSDVATTLAVPVAAWTGIFASEMMIRLRRFHAPSLLAPGGVYPAVRWVNLVGLVVISVIGFGLTSAQLAGLQWEGYLFGLLGVGADDPLAATDIGVLVALALGLVLPLVSGIPAIRRQERDRDPDAEPAPSAPLVD